MAASDITATERAEPVAWIEHHKGGDNLVWDPQKNGLRYSPLYLSTSPSQAQGETVCPGCGERPAGLCAECRLTASQHTTDPLIAALYAEQDRAHRYLARAEQAEAALAAEKRKAEDAREVIGKMLRFIDERASVSGYGFYRPANPHDFSPDHDSCSADELAAHKAACEAYDRGEYTAPKGSEFLRDDDGKVTLHILRAPWGIGSYSETDPDAVPLIDAARAFLAKGDGGRAAKAAAAECRRWEREELAGPVAAAVRALGQAGKGAGE